MLDALLQLVFAPLVHARPGQEPCIYVVYTSSMHLFGVPRLTTTTPPSLCRVRVEVYRRPSLGRVCRVSRLHVPCVTRNDFIS